jgi:hypothetical protein
MRPKVVVYKSLRPRFCGEVDSRQGVTGPGPSVHIKGYEGNNTEPRGWN